MRIGKRFAAFGVGFALAVSLINIPLGIIAIEGGGINQEVLVLGLAIGILFALAKVFAFSCLDTPNEKGWRVFLFILGILGLFLAVQAFAFDHVSSGIIELSQAFCFLMAFILRNVGEKKRDNHS
ncbi:hypothetical protein ACWOAN_00630 [Lactococcus taiwanensis]|uniref:hypothetical protein n=1 Tax=Lactococcus taiwanensis TaxID=1151742 RepID=UPI00190611DA|nr:hypothetical protein [Lactococcus taiwanensis]